MAILLGEGGNNSGAWTKPVAQARQKLATAGFSLPQVGQFNCRLGLAVGVKEILGYYTPNESETGHMGSVKIRHPPIPANGVQDDAADR
jgi:hypothetical protein